MIQAVPVNSDQGRIEGELTTLVEGVRTTSNGMAAFDLCDEATLSNLGGDAVPNGTVVARIDPEGRRLRQVR